MIIFVYHDDCDYDDEANSDGSVMFLSGYPGNILD